jgi:hypothetical protein
VDPITPLILSLADAACRLMSAAMNLVAELIAAFRSSGIADEAGEDR